MRMVEFFLCVSNIIRAKNTVLFSCMLPTMSAHADYLGT